MSRQTVTHEDGLVVQFVDGVVFPRPAIGTHCAADGVGEWSGTLLGGDDALVEFMRRHPALRDPASFVSRLERLMDEAGRVWARAKADEAAA